MTIDQEFWFDTTPVILVARDGTRFRLPKYLLARVSTVFSNMIQDGRPDEAHGEGAGSVVPMDDEAQDLRPFLRIITRSAIE